MKTVFEVTAMLELKRRGWSIRRITTELGATRKTVRKYIHAGRWVGYKPRGCGQVQQSVVRAEPNVATARCGAGPTRRVSSNASDRTSAKAKVVQWRWMHDVMQGLLASDQIKNAIGELDELDELTRRVRDGRLSERNKAVAVLASRNRIPSSVLCEFLGIDRKTARKYRHAFEEGGTAALFARQSSVTRRADDEKTKQAVFVLLHEPPASHGINRTTWKMEDLVRVLRAQGCPACPQVVRQITRAAGYKWRKARTVLTSHDPDYAEKVARVHGILSKLANDEVFFSIDEFGPFAVKMKGGLSLMPTGEQRIVPQWQRSKGCLILTAALELSGNQVTHFYSAAKNTGEMIRMMDVLVGQYAHCSRIYLSWDAASWHISKRLGEHIEQHNLAADVHHRPRVETAPLPTGAQFLNVIESVFSGMARAIIHNSDYPSLDLAKTAIDRYFHERNDQFRRDPRRAGNKIWGKERAPPVFDTSNNCKDPNYR